MLRLMSGNFKILKIYISINITQSYTIRVYNYIEEGG
jgi:hypothetical protein